MDKKAYCYQSKEVLNEVNSTDINKLQTWSRLILFAEIVAVKFTHNIVWKLLLLFSKLYLLIG